AQARLPAAEPAAAVMRLRLAAQRALLHERNNQLELARLALRELPLATIAALPADALEARADGWRAHAVLSMRVGDAADAASLYRRILALGIDHERRASAVFGLAAACDRIGRHDEAWQALRDAHATQRELAREVVPAL